MSRRQYVVCMHEIKLIAPTLDVCNINTSFWAFFLYLFYSWWKETRTFVAEIV